MVWQGNFENLGGGLKDYALLHAHHCSALETRTLQQDITNFG